MTLVAVKLVEVVLMNALSAMIAIHVIYVNQDIMLMIVAYVKIVQVLLITVLSALIAKSVLSVNVAFM